jgi:hypothetical protein
MAEKADTDAVLEDVETGEDSVQAAQEAWGRTPEGL